MKAIESYIVSLLHEQDCVILPEFGGLVLNKDSAAFDEIKNKVSPPGKRVSFNPRLTANDGSLVYAVSIGEQIPYDDAQVKVLEFVARLKKGLNTEGKAELTGIGSFKKELGKIIFRPSNFLKFDRDAFGLNPFHVAPLEETKDLRQQPVELKNTRKPIMDTPKKENTRKDAPKPKKEEAPKVVVEKKEEKEKRRFPWVAAVLLIPFIGYISWVLISAGAFEANYQFQASDLLPFSSSPSEPVVSDQNEGLADDSILVENETPMEEDVDSTNNEVEIVEVSEPEYKDVPLSNGRFHVIVGAFTSEYNANKLVEKLNTQGYSAQVVDQGNGMYRVSAQSFPSKNDAVNNLSSIQQELNPGAWIMEN